MLLEYERASILMHGLRMSLVFVLLMMLPVPFVSGCHICFTSHCSVAQMDDSLGQS